MQTIYNSFTLLPQLLQKLGIQKPLVVYTPSFQRTPAMALLREHFPHLEEFNRITPNPDTLQLSQAVAHFQGADCDGLIAAGGGSAMDVAKGVKFYCHCDPSQPLLQQKGQSSHLPVVAIPTTAGTGSEATHFAVIYDQGIKVSVADPSLVPEGVILDSSFLATLPLYQKKCTMLDAISQAVESYWAVKATPESRRYAQQALALLIPHVQGYLVGDAEAAEHIMQGAHLSGCAINLSTTTAAHAMSYQITKGFGLPHGHAVAVCLPKVWQFMLAHPEQTIHPQGGHGLQQLFAELSHLLGADTPQQAIAQWEQRLVDWGMSSPHSLDKEADLTRLSQSVNAARLGNNPVALAQEDLRQLYERILV